MGFHCRTPTGLGETETPLLEGTHKILCASGPSGRSSDPIGDWTKPTCYCWRGSCRGGGWLWLTVRTTTLAAEVLGRTLWLEPSQSLPLAPPKSWVGSSVGSLQAKQPTGREPSPTQQQLSGLRFYWALPTRVTASCTHHQSLPSENFHKPLR